MEKQLVIMVVDDEKNIRKVMEMIIEDMGHLFLGASNPEEAEKILQEKDVDIMVLDIKMPMMDGMEYLKKLNVSKPGIPVIMLSGHGTVSRAVEALKLGAVDFIEKNGDEELIADVINRVSASISDQTTGSLDGMICRDRKMSRIIKKIRAMGSKNISVLLHGESGVGKGMLAQYIHTVSGRRDEPLVTVNCGAVPVNLFESEMFGYEKGAFTGAVSRKIGKLEHANRGTLFLDEIDSLDLKSQVSLLRVIQERHFSRLGGDAIIESDFRLISASNNDLMTEVSKGLFREDLYFRINVMEIFIPPLRERKTDIIPMSNCFLQEFRDKYGGEPKYIHPDLESYLLNYLWPGNIRELKNFMERLYIMTDSDTLYFNEEYLVSMQLDIATMLRENERDIITRVLAVSGNDLEKTAKALNICVKELKMRIKEYEI